jgi:hypothetical protein
MTAANNLSTSASTKHLCIVYTTAIHQMDITTGEVKEIPVKDGTAAAYWSTYDNRLAVCGKNAIEFYKGNTKSGEFLLYPEGEWVLITTPIYSYSTTYYLTSNEVSEDSFVQIQLYYENGTRPIAAEDKKQFRDFSKLKNEF